MKTIINQIGSVFFLLLVSLGTAYSSTIYNENITGDIINQTDFGILSGNENLAIGSLDGTGFVGQQGPDETDTFIVEFLADWNIDLDLSTGTSLVVFMYEGLTSKIITAKTLTSTTALDFFGTRSAGSYMFALVPQGNTGSLTYQLNLRTAAVNSVPSPAAVFLIIFGMLMMFIVQGKTFNKRAV